VKVKENDKVQEKVSEKCNHLLAVAGDEDFSAFL